MIYILAVVIVGILVFVQWQLSKRKTTKKKITPSIPDKVPERKVRHGKFGSYTPSTPEYFSDSKDYKGYSNEAFAENQKRYDKLSEEVFGSMLIPNPKGKEVSDNEELNNTIDDANNNNSDDSCIIEP